jgi:hypothetical protein
MDPDSLLLSTRRRQGSKFALRPRVYHQSYYWSFIPNLGNGQPIYLLLVSTDFRTSLRFGLYLAPHSHAGMGALAMSKLRRALNLQLEIGILSMVLWRDCHNVPWILGLQLEIEVLCRTYRRLILI